MSTLFGKRFTWEHNRQLGRPHQSLFEKDHQQPHSLLLSYLLFLCQIHGVEVPSAKVSVLRISFA